MKHCGHETCAGVACDNWPKCKSETIPPWNCAPAASTASVCIREQDVLAASDELLEAALGAVGCEDKGNPTRCYDVNGEPYCHFYRLCKAAKAYRLAREGRRDERTP